MAELREHAGIHYAIQYHYALPDDSWCLELSEAVPAPAGGAPGTSSHLPGRAFLAAFVPDEDPAPEPTVHIHSHDEHVVPYEIMRWFMTRVTAEVDRNRAALAAVAAGEEPRVRDADEEGE
ncbi:hypothetical protein GCM10027168_71620 [Streptomyces capparidis]